MIDILSYESDRSNKRDNQEILLHTIDYIKSTKRLESSLIDYWLLLNNVYDKHFSSQNLNEKSLIDILSYESDRSNERDNQEILLHTIDYIKSTKRLERSLIDYWLLYVYFIIIFII